MTWEDWIDEIYMYLMMKMGWTLSQIDEMDIFYFIKLFWQGSKKSQDKELAQFDALGFF